MKNRVIENIDNNTLFIFVIIIILTTYFFSLFDITINIIFGFCLGLLVIYYLYNDKVTIDNRNNELIEKKKNLIQPKPLKAINYNQITDFLFTIQDFYKYNPIAYQLMIQYIDYFFETFENIIDDPSTVNLKYDMLISQKKSSINALHSIIYSLNPNDKYDQKLQNSMKRLDELLNVYIMKAHKIYEEELYKKGITHKIVKSLDSPDAYNNFDNNPLFNYDVV